MLEFGADDALRLQAEPVAVEAHRPLEVIDAERDERYPRLHPLTYPAAGVAEHFDPRRVLAEAGRAPGVLHAPEAAFGMRHDDGEAAVGGGEAGDALRRAARIVGIDLGRLAAIVDVAHTDELRIAREFGAAFAVCGDDRNAASRHAAEEDG